MCAQINFCVGDTAGNTHAILAAIASAREAGADIIVFPELSLTGYPPEDILYREAYLDEVDQALSQVERAATGIAVVVGHPYRHDGALYNAVSVFDHQSLIARYCKQCLPNTQVFDEYRYFKPGSQDVMFTLKGVRYAVVICEDIWHNETLEKVKRLKVDVLLVPNASPFSDEKPRLRHEILAEAAAYLEHPIVYVNLVGGQDQLVFDGGSCAFDKTGNCISQAPWFESCLWPITLGEMGTITPEPSTPELMYRAIVLATRDYCVKNGFHSVVLGLSGGIDSALTLAILSDALGSSAVHPIYLPSIYSRDISLKGAQAQCDTLGIPLKIVPIDTVVSAVNGALSSALGDLSSITLQNIQSRARGMLMMGVSNQIGAMLISTGNKSEFAVGYTTLYGDMCGGFAPLKDVYKTDVYRLVRYRNGVSPIIPDVVITRPPSAELAPDQEDVDDLPPYPVLDAILKAHIEGGEDLSEIVAASDLDIDISRIINMLYRNEYKRQQAPPGPKVTTLAFGRDRRYAMTNGFKG